MKIKSDKYSLGKSSTLTISEKGEEIELNVALERNTKSSDFNIGASISGKVQSTENLPLENAVVKLMDENLKALTHTITDSEGNYLLSNIPKSNLYILAAIYTGKLINETEPFSLPLVESKTIDFILQDDPNSKLGAISGTLTTIDFSQPIFGSVISLYNLVNSKLNLVSITYTDSSGSFIFSELTPGEYTITTSALGYMPSKSDITITSNKISILNISLSNDSTSSSSIISGVILDSNNKFIPNADVILYSIDLQNNLTPIAFTTANSHGIYSFINVPKGTFLVKSKQSQLITITSPPQSPSTQSLPSFDVPFNSNPSTPSLSPNINDNLLIDSFILSEEETLYYKSLNIADGLLSNKASIDSFTGFTKNIGGPTDGKSSISIDIPNTTNYMLSISYLSGDKTRSLKIDINGISSNSIYYFPKTKDWSISSVSTVTVPLFLLKGKNTLTFHGDNINFSPNLGQCIITETLDVGFIDAKEGLLLNSAILNENTNFIDNIGGPSDGSATFKVNSPYFDTYLLAIEYLSGDQDRPLKIEINGKGLGTIYTVPKTIDWDFINTSIFTLPISLNEGYNIITLHGDTINYGPSISNIKISKIKYSNIIEPSQYTLSGNATIKNGSIIGLGGVIPASVSFKANVPKTGLYNLKLSYKSLKDNSIKISVNNVEKNEIYNLNSSNLNYIHIKLNLNIGENLIKVYS
ncbi:carboxypeptidase regulatory-like domain-containing protein [Clostridium tarantellae]|uniref:CBM6 domain-containing protein n=1 Tax=Clostridium tarantellae TaxID=39493 RepID=A0A6I1MKG8_9CLOT|nr:carboxypeptidase regulatory-like domain-containing protein [Clostridium tarantellae]MPQ43203.1 hypothetical protein [Clostridium tarantellae]